MSYDVVIIGAGPGGYVSAIRCSQLGLKTLLIERENLGGICLNWGCIPTKSFLKSAEVYKTIKEAEEFGIENSIGKVNLEKIVKRSKLISRTLSDGIFGLLKKNKVDIEFGFAELISANKVQIKSKEESKIITSKYVILATGARARILPGYEPNGDRIWTYREALNPKFTPKSLVVVGSGAIGSEFAYFYNSIGVKVTILESSNRILPSEDVDVSDFVKKSFEKDGINCLTSIKLISCKKSKSSVELDYEINGKKEKISSDALIMAVGVVPNTENIGLEKIGVKKDEKGIVSIDSYCKTSIDNIYAIGDIVQGPWLAHKASHEGVIVAEKIAEKMKKYDAKDTHSVNKLNIPGCIYSHPQVASIGLTEEKAKASGFEIRIGKFPLIANGKANAIGDSFGFVKIIFDKKTGEILGCHMVGPEVTEMIQGIAIAKSAELVEKDLIHTIFPHPTISESVHEAVLNAFGIGLHF